MLEESIEEVKENATDLLNKVENDLKERHEQIPEIIKQIIRLAIVNLENVKNAIDLREQIIKILNDNNIKHAQHLANKIIWCEIFHEEFVNYYFKISDGKHIIQNIAYRLCENAHFGLSNCDCQSRDVRL